ncbi:hypothetical protein H9L39_19302 [Fusarium oxysporum f. sp. albedinis]|nr:hypothetical protein H9L39_19302 [Fusarium oxysporum f. sp. albedinis]
MARNEDRAKGGDNGKGRRCRIEPHGKEKRREIEQAKIIPGQGVGRKRRAVGLDHGCLDEWKGKASTEVCV